MSYHDLRLKLHKLADRGLLNRAECYALLYVLETSSYRPEMGAKVEQATRLLDTLTDLVVEPPAPARPRIAIIGAPESVASTLAAMHAHPYGRELDLTGVSITRSELPDVRNMKEKGLHIEVADLMASDHHRPRPFFSTQLFGLIEDELAALDKQVPALTQPIAFHAREYYEEPPKAVPEPQFKGYHGKGKQRKYPRPR